MIVIRQMKSRTEKRQFINFQYELYKNDEYFIPPIKVLIKNQIIKGKNSLLTHGIHAYYMAFKYNRPCGRILCGINEALNEKTGLDRVYFTLFECIDDKEVAFALFEQVKQFAKEHGMNEIWGPCSPNNGDEDRGIQIEGFEGSPVLFCAYNPEYYVDFFNTYGFSKDFDLFAYYSDIKALTINRYEKVVTYSKKKFNYRIDKLNLKKIDEEIIDIKKVLDQSMPDYWDHLVPPSLDDIKASFKDMKMFLDPDLIQIARSNDEPVGFVVGIPDYNQVIKKMNGNLFPFGILKFLYWRKRIDGVKVFMQFVIPEFRNKAVNGAIFFNLMKELNIKGYKKGEGSCIAEMNIQSIRSVVNAGGQKYRTYRLYKKNVDEIIKI